MLIKLLKSKLHRARVTGAKVHYPGSIAVDAELMEAVRVCSLGQITQALYDVGGQYRRNM